MGEPGVSTIIDPTKFLSFSNEIGGFSSPLGLFVSPKQPVKLVMIEKIINIVVFFKITPQMIFFVFSTS